MKIDAVITWVDGDDPKHKEKREKYGSKDIFNKQDIGGATRFANLGEIYWCVVSLNRFAPWLNKIYIVTDGQDPKIEDYIKELFPNGYIPMEIVDHKIIFRGYEEYLPTFNSVSLETMTWRIPGLSDCFIEFNDDLMLASPVLPEDFFTADGKPILYAKKKNLIVEKFKRLYRYCKEGKGSSKKVVFKELMMNAAMIAKTSEYHYFRLKHTPKSLRRDFYEKYFAEHPDLMIRNIKHRFRSLEQYTPQELQYLVLYKNGECLQLDPDGFLFYMQPKSRKNYVLKKLAKLDEMKNCKFLCFNSIDLASKSDQTLIFDKLKCLLK